MHILYLCPDHGIPVYGRRGCSTHVRETCCALVEAGHEVVILCSRLGQDERGGRPLEVIEVKPPMSRKLGYDLRNAWHNRAFHSAARQIIEQRGIEALYERFSLYALAGTRLAKRYGLPHVVEVNAFLSVEHRKKLHFPRLAETAERYIARRASALAVVSEPLRDTLVEMGVARERIVIVPMAVNLDLFRPDPDGRERIRQEWNLNGRYVVGYVGGLAEWHGIALLHDMAAELLKSRDDFTIFVVGGDDARVQANRRKAADRRLERHLVFTGGVPYDQVPAYINAMDAALVPDTNYWTCPTKMFEYQATGIPTIAPRYPAVVQAMDHGQEGLLFEPKAVGEAVAAILELGARPAEGRAMGRKAMRRAAASRSWRHNAQRIVTLFENLRAGRLPDDSATSNTRRDLSGG